MYEMDNSDKIGIVANWNLNSGRAEKILMQIYHGNSICFRRGHDEDEDNNNDNDDEEDNDNDRSKLRVRVANYILVL